MPVSLSKKEGNPAKGPLGVVESRWMVGTYHDEYQFFELTNLPVFNYPAGVQTGDTVFCVISTYTTVTPPAGWTLVTSQKASQEFGATNLTVYIYKDTYDAADGTTATFTLGDHTNCTGQILALPGTWNVIDSKVRMSHKVLVDYVHHAPVVTATANGQVALIASVCNYSFAYGTPEGSYYVAYGLRQLSPSAELPDVRLGISYRVMNNGDVLGGGHTHGSHSYHLGAEASVLLEEVP